MTMIWCLSPLVGFFLTPIMGSMSDRCGSRLGRRRPFIIIVSIGVILGETNSTFITTDNISLRICFPLESAYT